MLAEIHIGYLNIAEAMIEVQAKPLKTEQLLAEMDLGCSHQPDHAHDQPRSCPEQ